MMYVLLCVLYIIYHSRNILCTSLLMDQVFGTNSVIPNDVLVVRSEYTRSVVV